MPYKLFPVKLFSLKLILRWVKPGLRPSLLAVMVLGLVINIPKPVTGQTQPALSSQQSAELAEAKRLNEQAVQLYQQGRNREAIPFLEKALIIRERILGKEHPDVAQSLNNLAALYQSQGNYSKAESLYVRSLSIREKILGKEHPSVATSLNNLAALYQSQGNYDKAESLYVRSLSISEKALGKQHPDVAQSLNNLAEIYRAQGNYNKAEPLYMRSLSIWEKALGKEHPDLAIGLNNLALLYQAQGNYSKAESLYMRSLSIWEKALGKEHSNVATSLNNLAELYRLQGNYSKSEPLYMRSLSILEKVLGEEHPNVATSLNNLALLYRAQGNYSKAETLYVRSLSITEKALGKEHPDVANSLNNLAGLYQTQGNYSQAESLFMRSLSIWEKALGKEHPDLAIGLNNLALLYSFQGNYSQAESLFMRSLSITEKALGKEHLQVATRLNNLAGLYWSKGDINRTTAFLARGLAVQEKNLQFIYAAGSEQSKQEYAQKFIGSTDSTITLALQKSNQNSTLNKLALTTILRRKGRVMDAMADTVQILQSQLANSPETKKLFDQWLSTQQQLANLIYRGAGEQKFEIYQKQIKELETQKEELENQISRKSADFRKEIKPVELADIQTQIPTDAAMVEIIQYYPLNPKAKKESEKWGQPRYAAVALRSTGEPKWVDLGDAAAIDKSVTSFRQLLATSPGNNRGIDVTPNPEAQKSQISKLQELARNLDKQVMQPIRPLLGNARHILLSPDGQLNLIPFEALRDEQNKYLVENYAFSYLTTGRDLLRLDNTPKQLNNPVIFAGIDYDKQENLTATETKNRGNKRSINFANLTYGFLKGTLEEAQAIQKILPNAQLFTGTKATETAVKQVQTPSILHLATHGFFLADQEVKPISSQSNSPQAVNVENSLLRSGLALAGFNDRRNKQDNNSEDGVLTALEVAGLSLRGTQLAILSACETGLGNVKNGDGVYGLRRALVIAGTQSQLLSLWKVDDTGTKDLMVKYYEKIKAGKGRHAALRETQLELLKNSQYQHPYYWASFIPSGNWQPMK